MAYIAQSDLVPRRLTLQELKELTDDAKTGEVDATLVTDICASASGTVDSYAGGRYTLPLTVTEQIKDVTLDIAVYRLFQRRRKTTTPRGFSSDTVGDAYVNAISFLKDVAAGRASLDQPAKTQSSEMDVRTKDHTTDPDVFDDLKTEGF